MTRKILCPALQLLSLQLHDEWSNNSPTKPNFRNEGKRTEKEVGGRGVFQNTAIPIIYLYIPVLLSTASYEMFALLHAPSFKISIEALVFQWNVELCSRPEKPKHPGYDLITRLGGAFSVRAESYRVYLEALKTRGGLMVFKKVFGFIWFLLYLAIISLFGCSQNIVITVPSGEPTKVVKAGPARHNLKISRHASVTFSNEEADKILGVATEVAQIKDGPEDVTCDVTLAHEGPVAEFTNSTTPSFMTSYYDYKAVVFDNPSHIKVLAGMDWCGEKFIPNVLVGCTAPGNSMTVVADLPENLREPSDQDKIKGIMWLHEYGHLVGLIHRNHQKAVMHEAIEPDRTWLNERECG